MASEFYRNMRNDRRGEILAAAKQRLLRDGFGQTMMTSIARDVGISRQTLYKYFDSLDEIIFTIQRQILQERGQLQRQLIPDTSVFEAFDSAIELLFHDIEENPDDWQFLCLFDLYMSRHSISEDLIRDYDDMILQGGGFLELLKRGQTEGIVRTDLPADTLFGIAVTTILAVAQRTALVGMERLNIANRISAKDLSDNLKVLTRTYLKA